MGSVSPDPILARVDYASRVGTAIIGVGLIARFCLSVGLPQLCSYAIAYPQAANMGLEPFGLGASVP